MILVQSYSILFGKIFILSNRLPLYSYSSSSTACTRRQFHYAYEGALGVRIATMVANLSSHKKGWDERWNEFSAWAVIGQQYKNELLSLVDADTAAFNKIMEAFAMPKATDEEKAKRTEAIQAATKYAIDILFNVMQTATASMEVVKAMANTHNPNSVSDAGVGALCVRSAVMGAFMNVRINAAGYNDAAYVKDIIVKSKAIEDAVFASEGEVLRVVNEKIGV